MRLFWVFFGVCAIPQFGLLVTDEHHLPFWDSVLMGMGVGITSLMGAFVLYKMFGPIGH